LTFEDDFYFVASKEELEEQLERLFAEKPDFDAVTLSRLAEKMELTQRREDSELFALRLCRGKSSLRECRGQPPQKKTQSKSERALSKRSKSQSRRDSQSQSAHDGHTLIANSSTPL
tara:strand:+ start:449 stop:799 length:351 start_codon:yes stop_codon:yes gene_type:complete